MCPKTLNPKPNIQLQARNKFGKKIIALQILARVHGKCREIKV
jgi:hypothetical protein